ncbi:hypothetical protein CY35_08G093600 [Sphagnum magellanicum]|nr:hypothetical protein CY35_08G093600 [Sphagnum magellanicum]KAH9555036.1 hypothetical protein CY35_08G093600 [Sphagnum magellanicum]
MMMTMIITPKECQNLEQEEEPGGDEALNPRMQCSLPDGEGRSGISLDCGREEVGNMEEGTTTTCRSELESRSSDPSAAATATTAVVRSIMDDGKFNAQMAADLLTKWETPSTPPNSLDYLLINGKRIVRPYFFEFLAHVKKRWDGKTIVDLFADEFRQRPHEYYVQAVECGRIRVDGKIVSPSYVVHDSQKLSHFVHRHEPPVMAESVTILEEGVDVITVCKPPSVPVHACGQYRKNTVVGILQAEHNNIGPLFPVHRLDRLVSGLLILARNVHTANFFRQEIEGGCIQKQYVAKVKGVFPADEVRIPHVEEEGKVLLTSKEGGTIGVLAEESDAKYKDACTRFQRLSTDGNYSLVRCMPQTGRTHQIRVHLQHLGHPIANDALYLQANVAKRSKLNTSADRAAKDHLSVCAERCSVRASEGESATSSSAICSMKDAGSLYDEQQQRYQSLVAMETNCQLTRRRATTNLQLQMN